MTTREATGSMSAPEQELHPESEQPGADPPAAARDRRTRVLALVAALVLVGSAIGVSAWRNQSASTSTAAPVESLPTAEVQRGTLTASESRDATITYADTSTLASGTTGLVTWLPASGKEIARGRGLARINEQYVIAMYGTIPAFRSMTNGDSGRDVAQLEQNLAALGYSGFTVDDTYTATTASAVDSWQADSGLPETGTVLLGQVAFLPGEVKVGAMSASVGDQVNPGSALYAISTSGRVVSATLSEQDRDLAVVGAPVTINAGSAGTASGTISAVVAVASASGQGNDSSTSTNYLTTVAIDPKGTGAADLDKQADGSPVKVEFASQTAKDVLSVPVKALLALAEGGYGVEVVNPDSSTSITAVTTGLFANGRVEVTGDGLSEGATVRTAR